MGDQETKYTIIETLLKKIERLEAENEQLRAALKALGTYPNTLEDLE